MNKKGTESLSRSAEIKENDEQRIVIISIAHRDGHGQFLWQKKSFRRSPL